MIPVILPLYERADIDFTHGSGAYLYSKDGKKYLDFAAGYAAVALGHCHPKLVKALSQQTQKLWHLSNRYKIPGMEEYCRKLVDLTFGDTVFLANSGAEAVECMIKMARRYFNEKGEQRYRIITMEGAFHGRTLATASAGAKEKMIGFEPVVDGFDRVAWNDLEALSRAITPATAAVMLEPIQGEGGMRAANQDYLKAVRKLCDSKGILLLLDEVQSGMCRSGYMFAHEMYGIKPDLMALGKGLGSGFPISACIATESVGKAMKTGTHGSTFGGNPLAVAVAAAVLEVMSEPGFLPHVRSVGSYLSDKLKALKEVHADKIEEITGAGLMLGIKLKSHIDADKFTLACRQCELLSIPAAANTMRLTPPLIIDAQHCDEAMEKLDKALDLVTSATFKIKDGFTTIKHKLGF
jgi:acetylornithine/N-succinyldiaminopimelate aminotransferase